MGSSYRFVPKFVSFWLSKKSKKREKKKKLKNRTWFFPTLSNVSQIGNLVAANQTIKFPCKNRLCLCFFFLFWFLKMVSLEKKKNHMRFLLIIGWVYRWCTVDTVFGYPFLFFICNFCLMYFFFFFFFLFHFLCI